jgi:hypothetical protein
MTRPDLPVAACPTADHSAVGGSPLLVSVVAEGFDGWEGDEESSLEVPGRRRECVSSGMTGKETKNTNRSDRGPETHHRRIRCAYLAECPHAGY